MDSLSRPLACSSFFFPVPVNYFIFYQDYACYFSLNPFFRFRKPKPRTTRRSQRAPRTKQVKTKVRDMTDGDDADSKNRVDSSDGKV